MKKAGKQLLYQRLYELGLAESPKEAQALMMTGKVLVNDQPAKAGMRVGPDDAIRIKGVQMPYLAKGGLKLAGALAAFDASPMGQVCLDAGASAGGFTDCLIKQGAAKVYAVDVGFGQLLGSLRQHPRVVNLERTNLSAPELLTLSPRPSFATCDLSYLSLREAVPIYRAILHGSGTLLAVKPLFEVDDALARRTGEIADSAYAPLLRDLARCLNAQEGTRDGCLRKPGHRAQRHHRVLFHVVFGGEGTAPQLEDAILSSVGKALQVKAQALENADV